MKGAGEILAREVIPQRSRVIQLVFSASGKRRISAPKIGIRVALGARRSDVLGLVLKEALRLTAVGVGLGLVGAFAATLGFEELALRSEANRSGDVHLSFVVVDASCTTGELQIN